MSAAPADLVAPGRADLVAPGDLMARGHPFFFPGHTAMAAACEARMRDGRACPYRAKGSTGDGRRVCGVHLRHGVDSAAECPICLSEIETRSTCCRMNCGHPFHTKCLRSWFRNRALSCPMCRATCLEGLSLVGGRRLAPKLRALVRTAPPPPRAFFPAYIISHLESPVVQEALGCDKNVTELLVDVACECFTQDNFFAKIHGMQL